MKNGTQADLQAELAKQGFLGPVAFEGNVVAIGASAVPAAGRFTTTPFGGQLAARYKAGVSMLFAANIEQFPAPPLGNGGPGPMGFDNLRTIIAEHKGTLRDPVQTAEFSFNGARKGVASWLTQPGPMGSLEFMSRDASFAAAVMTRDPRDLMEELMRVNGAQTADAANEFWKKAGVDVLNDIAGSLGGEAAFALDGPLLPTPGWKIVVEVEDAARLQHAMEQIAAAMNTDHPGSAKLEHEMVEGRTFYVLSGGPKTIHYTFVDGYWLMGANRALLMQAIQDRAAGLTLPRSPEFRSQLPADGPAFFSGLFYYNMGAVVGPVADQLKATGMLTPDLQSKGRCAHRESRAGSGVRLRKRGQDPGGKPQQFVPIRATKSCDRELIVRFARSTFSCYSIKDAAQ